MRDQRFRSLDAMRGIAALAVVILHIGDVMNLPTVRYAYLAVDFFFILSGFVLAHAYEPRLRATLTGYDFFRMRMIRLYPTFALGILFGAVNVAGQVVEHSPSALPPLGAAGAFVMNALMLPALSSPTDLFPLNHPAWSLFFEMAINILFVVLLYRQTLSVLVSICIFSGALFLLSILPVGHANVGMYWPQIGLGFFRVGFSFSAGMILARLYDPAMRIRSPISLAPIVILAAVLALLPQPRFDFIYDVVVIFLVMPMLLWLGALYELPSGLEKAGAFMGDISYPLYAIHFPLLQMFSYIFARKLHLPGPVVAAVFLPSVVFLAWFLARHFDIPVRRWLNGRARHRSAAIPIIG